MPTHSDLPNRVLIVEDEAVIAFDLEDALRNAGYDPIGPALTLAEALLLVEATNLDAAIVDVGMVQGKHRGFVQTLIAGAVPFLFLTGYGTMDVPADLPTVDTVLKPFHTPDLLRSLSDLLAADTAAGRRLRPAPQLGAV